MSMPNLENSAFNKQYQTMGGTARSGHRREKSQEITLIDHSYGEDGIIPVNKSK